MYKYNFIFITNNKSKQSLIKKKQDVCIRFVCKSKSTLKQHINIIFRNVYTASISHKFEDS